MEQMKFNPMTEREMFMLDVVSEAIGKVEEGTTKEIDVRTNEEAYGIMALDMMHIKTSEKAIRKKMEELLKNLEAGTEVQAILGDIYAEAGKLAAQCIVMAAEAKSCIMDLQ